MIHDVIKYLENGDETPINNQTHQKCKTMGVNPHKH